MAEAHTKNHDYHLVDPSPWPFTGAVGAFVMAVGAIAMMKWNLGEELVLFGADLTGWGIFAIGLSIILYTMFGWWRDTVREGRAGDHTPVVQLHLRYGMILFIASEVMFFLAWFWAYFDAALFPGEAIQYARTELTGGTWPPEGIHTFDPWHLPLFNTIILLLSGTTVTWAHHALLHNDRKGLKLGLLTTVLLGLLFSCVQAYEYAHAAFDFSGNIYGATFFMATGFHGFHVIVGTIFLTVCLIRALKGHFTPEAHFGFEAAAWYWHFVDVVWLFLFICIYVWGAGTPAH
ncbi:cytochrome c oxidase subunit 3 [Rhodobium orientis]|uniref:Cytochrome c oxidase subunit 3 n=1 Tax=Rhodobium orientis TaxID=34017 RepID=A0A327JR60_9HYPH|nr:cytochrome c oxidase subunit 3 [Rhodobium orientis]MBB4304222.1 cytochrome c oxidase subunit 3 [Rhodobium orientis]MBK5950691.1 cytochrome c oxidase subunit 3 [Rhodobium orientis]RAI28066.1 cytochrome c oxidase subunit 3 [Rhodobium orientis]